MFIWKGRAWLRGYEFILSQCQHKASASVMTSEFRDWGSISLCAVEVEVGVGRHWMKGRASATVYHSIM